MVCSFVGHSNKVYSAVFLSKKLALTASHDRTMRTWDLETVRLRLRLRHGQGVRVRVWVCACACVGV